MSAGTKADGSYDAGQGGFRWRDIYYSRQILSPNGSVGTPAKSWNNSPLNGFYHIGTNNIGFAASGVKAWDMSAAGERTLPLQPSFLAFLDSAGSTVNTTTGATLTGFVNEVFDRGSNFSSSAFTAPVTGLYRFGCKLMVSGSILGAEKIYISTTNYTFKSSRMNPNEIRPEIDVLAPMNAGDRASVVYEPSGAGPDILYGIGSQITSFFCGYLVA